MPTGYEFRALTDGLSNTSYPSLSHSLSGNSALGLFVTSHVVWESLSGAN
jgi:hypothetical protein